MAAQANVELVESAEFHVLNMYYLALYSITALKSDQVWWSRADPNGSAAALHLACSRTAAGLTGQLKHAAAAADRLRTKIAEPAADVHAPAYEVRLFSARTSLRSARFARLRRKYSSTAAL